MGRQHGKPDRDQTGMDVTACQVEVGLLFQFNPIWVFRFHEIVLSCGFHNHFL